VTTVSLGEVAEMIMGQAPPGRECNKDGRGTIFVKAGEFNGRHPVVREWTTRPLKIAKSSDVLVCVVGATAGKVSASIDCAIGRSVAAVRPRADKVCTDYLYHYLTTQTDALRAQSQGLAQGVITREMLRDVLLPMPPLEEQMRIAAILDQADDLRRKRWETLERLEALKRSILEVLVDDANHVTRTISLGDIVSEFRYGTSEKASEVGHPVLRIPNVIGNAITLDELKYITLNARENERLKLRDGDLLFVRTNDNREYVGRSAVVTAALGENIGLQPGDFVYASYLIRARLKPGLANPIFLQAYLSGSNGRKAILERAKTSAGQFNINVESLQSIPVQLPSIDEQRQFARNAQVVDHLTSSHRAHLAKLDALFASLQHRAFRGEL
jgi:type I restriction enzyme, S subunit